MDKSFQNLLTQVASGEKALDHALNARRDDICQHLTQELETMKLELFDKDHHKRVLDSLFFPEMTARQEGISDSYRDTFQWIFEHDFDANEPSSVPGDDFMEWIEHGEDIYWISGKFGSGKSTLMRLICEDSRVSEALAKWSGTKSLVTTQFFLFMPSAQSLQKTVSGLLRAILYQILDRQPNLTPLAVPDGTSRIGTWTNKRLKTALTRILKECSTSVAFCMFVDGLDELDSDVTELLELLRSFSHMRNVKLCVSSRPEHILERHLSQYKKLRMQDLTYKDLKKYAEGKLWEYFRQQDYCDIGEDKISDLVRQLTSQAHGVFVWMKLAVDSILRGIMYGDSYDLLQARVEELPPDIDKLYEHMLSKIDHVHKARVARYIRARMAHGSTVAHPDGSESAPLHEIFILSVLTLALLDLDSDKDNEMMFHDTPDEIELEKHCLKAQQGILAQCVGFLELPNIHRGVAEIHAKREEIKSGSCLARFDSERCSVEFAHRTASDFFKTHGEVLVGMGRDLPQTWTPDEALARAMIRRMEVLPWMFDLLQAGLLYEPVQCLCYVYSAEIAQERAFPDVISALDDVAQSIASHPNMAETKDSTWNHFVPSFAIYYISDMGINEVCAIFNLYHFIKHTLQNNQVDRDALLICAFLTAGPLGYLPLHFKLVKLLLQEGSNPNVPFIAKSATHFRHGQLFQKSGYTAWMESLDHANDENDVDGEKAIQCTLDMMRDFVLHGADPNAVSESERVPIRFVVSQQIGAYFLSSVFVSVTLSPLAILNDLFPTRLSGFPDYSKYIHYIFKARDEREKSGTHSEDEEAGMNVSRVSSVDPKRRPHRNARESCDMFEAPFGDSRSETIPLAQGCGDSSTTENTGPQNMNAGYREYGRLDTWRSVRPLV